jgi:hypothetical protein
VSKHKAARHRGAPARAREATPSPAPSGARAGGHRAAKPARVSLTRTATRTGLAVATTGVVVTGGVIATSSADPVVSAGTAPAALASLSPVAAGATDAPGAAGAEAGVPAAGVDEEQLGRELVSRRGEQVSRSDRRAAVDPAKAAALSVDSPADAGSEDLSSADPRDIARALLSDFGFGSEQFSCLDSLYMSESGWRVNADNPYSSAYGIPQALPGSKMASAGADWATNPETQIRWGLGYIQGRYGTPCGAWSFKSSHGWY